jgi:hypothetical protein
MSLKDIYLRSQLQKFNWTQFDIVPKCHLKLVDKIDYICRFKKSPFFMIKHNQRQT